MKNTLEQYRQWLVALKEDINQSKQQTALQVNQNMLLLYWYLGKQIIQKTDIEGWGTRIIPRLSEDLQKDFPDLQGFSARNLLYMKQFSSAYPELLVTQQAAAQMRKNGNSSVIQERARYAKAKRKTLAGKSYELVAQTKNSITQQAAAQFNRAIILQLESYSAGQKITWMLTSRCKTSITR